MSVKTRIGFETESIEEWIGFLLKQKLAALTIHLRTVEELSKVPAHWELMPKIIKIRNILARETIIIGNGDVATLNEVYKKYKEYNCDGFMIGRGIFTNPWLFNTQRVIRMQDISINERLNTFLKQARLHEKIWRNTKNFANLKKFCKAYITNFSDAAVYRDKIMKTNSMRELIKTITLLQEKYL